MPRDTFFDGVPSDPRSWTTSVIDKSGGSPVPLSGEPADRGSRCSASEAESHFPVIPEQAVFGFAARLQAETDAVIIRGSPGDCYPPT